MCKLLLLLPLLWGQSGCNAVEPLYVSTYWTRGAWVGEDRTIELLTRDNPPEKVRATALHIQSGPLWSRPAHPRQNPRNVTGWNAVLTDQNNVILPDDRFSDGSKLRVHGLMWTAGGIVDKAGRSLHTPDDTERKFGVFVVEVRDVGVVHEAPATTQPIVVYTTVPRSPPVGKVQLFVMLVDEPGPASRNVHASSQPASQPAMKLTAKAVSSTRIDIRWTAVPGAVEYRIELSHDGKEFFDSATLDPSDTWATNEDLTPGKEHFFRVVALGPEEKALATSNVASAKTLPER